MAKYNRDWLLMVVSGAAALPLTAREYPYVPHLVRYGSAELLSEAAFAHLAGLEIGGNTAPAPAGIA
uniref:Uncharacterized protein n=1 Tax=Romanomermis culicivorax TaxID=13658 RepID=A0A915JEZ4_ROMCU